MPTAPRLRTQDGKAPPSPPSLPRGCSLIRGQVGSELPALARSRHGPGVWTAAPSRAAGAGAAGAVKSDEEIRGSKRVAGDEGL